MCFAPDTGEGERHCESFHSKATVPRNVDDVACIPRVSTSFVTNRHVNFQANYACKISANAFPYNRHMIFPYSTITNQNRF